MASSLDMLEKLIPVKPKSLSTGEPYGCRGHVFCLDHYLDLKSCLQTLHESASGPLADAVEVAW
jgi:hypothetical protein